jgi:hypothetical protein
MPATIGSRFACSAVPMRVTPLSAAATPALADVDVVTAGRQVVSRCVKPHAPRVYSCPSCWNTAPACPEAVVAAAARCWNTAPRGRKPSSSMPVVLLSQRRERRRRCCAKPVVFAYSALVPKGGVVVAARVLGKERLEPGGGVVRCPIALRKERSGPGGGVAEARRVEKRARRTRRRCCRSRSCCSQARPAPEAVFWSSRVVLKWSAWKPQSRVLGGRSCWNSGAPQTRMPVLAPPAGRVGVERVEPGGGVIVAGRVVLERLAPGGGIVVAGRVERERLGPGGGVAAPG